MAEGSRRPPRQRSIRSLADLRLALIADERIRDRIAAGVPCALVPVDPEMADLLVVESSGLDRNHRGAISQGSVSAAARGFREAGVGTAIWLSSTRDAATATEALLADFDHVFAPHPYAADLVADVSPARPAVLMPAAAPVALEADVRKKAGVIYLGGYSARWSPRSLALIRDYLNAGREFGLRIVSAPGSDLEALPPKFAGHAQLVDTPAEALELLAASRALIAPAPVEESESVPEVVMDALAARVRVIMPANIAARMALPGIVEFAAPGKQLTTALAECTGEGEEDEERRDLGRKVIHHTHTYRHRLTTLASAFGFRLFPGNATG